MDDLHARERRARMLAGLAYLGVPLVSVAAVGAVRLSEQLFAVVAPVVVLVVAAVLLVRERFRPVRWPMSAGLLGAVSALVTPVSLGWGWGSLFFLPVALVGFVIGTAFGRSVAQAILYPPVPALATSRYELAYRIRGLPLVMLTIGADGVTLSVVTSRRVPKAERSRTYPYAEVTGVYPVTLSGAERLRFPIPLPAAPIGTAGDALILQARGDDWVLPLDAAPALADLINDRRS